jgi:hypothetical protein
LLFEFLDAGAHPARAAEERMGWTLFGRSESQQDSPNGGIQQDRFDLAQVEQALSARGVLPDASRSLASRMASQIAALPHAEREAMLDGAALASGVHQESHDKLAQSLKGLREVERMMGAFSGELSKLDEVLEVLAAYVQRMRTSGVQDADRTLH